MKICINVIATNKYIEFVPQLVESIDKYFLIGHDIHVNIFSDKKGRNYKWNKETQVFDVNENQTQRYGERLTIHSHIIPAYGWPDATLRRYEIMTSIDYDCDYIFYLDADMKIVDYVGDEILGDLVAVRHPGYFVANGWGSENCDIRSKAYVPKELQKKYYAGGFQGGKETIYYLAMNLMMQYIDDDMMNGVVAQWHDETHWNKFLIDKEEYITELNPSYCLPEAISKRRYSKIENFPPKILALEKSLEYFRN